MCNSSVLQTKSNLKYTQMNLNMRQPIGSLMLTVCLKIKCIKFCEWQWWWAVASRLLFNSRNSLYVHIQLLLEASIWIVHDEKRACLLLVFTFFHNDICARTWNMYNIQWRLKHLLTVDICNCLYTVHFAEQTDIMLEVSAIIGSERAMTKMTTEISTAATSLSMEMRMVM